MTGPLDQRTGQVIAEDALDRIFLDVVGDRFSHRMLNELPEFEGRVPTAENILMVLHEALKTAIEREGEARLSGVRLVETSRNIFDQGEIR